MRLWQATWDVSGSLLIWGESLSSNPFVPEPEAVIDETGTQHHPFACPSEELLNDAAALEIQNATACEIALLLPTVDGKPSLSPKFAKSADFESPSGSDQFSQQNADAQHTDAGIPLNTWHTPAICLQPVDALSFLTAIPGELPEGLWLDDSIEFWKETSKLVLELLTRGRFLPRVERTTQGWRSRWTLLPADGNDQARLAQIVSCMPPICRAFQQPVSQATAQGIVEHFLADGADALIRLFLSRHSLLTGVPQQKYAASAPVQLAWLTALNSAAPEIAANESAGTEFELLRFHQRLEQWSARVMPRARLNAFRTCFQLLSPAQTSAAATNRTWVLELLLQIGDDPAKRIPTSAIWRSDPAAMRLLRSDREAAEEALLSDLGRAVRVFPALKAALDDPHPTHVELTTQEAYAFLRESSKLLEQEQFIVLLPNWWHQADTQVGLSLHVSSDGSPGEQFLSLKELLQCTWTVSVAGEKLTAQEFEQLVTSAGPLAEIGGRWIELRPEQTKQTLAFLKSQEERKQISMLEALRFGFGVENDNQLLPVVEFSASGWLEQLLDASREKVPQLAEPSGFEGQLRTYQRDGLSWLGFLSDAGIGACLADDMGLGKTVQLLALLAHERTDPAVRPGPTLLIVPMSTLENWDQETKRFCPNLKVYMHHGTFRLSGGQFIAEAVAADIVLTTYSLAFRDETLLTQVPWRRIALDEAQNIKNLETKQTQSIRRLSQSALAASRNCHRIALTGTPLENHLDELWSIFDFLNPGFLGTFSDFRTRFVAPIERDRSEPAAKALSGLIRPFLLRRVKSDPKIISDLPEKIEMTERTGLSEEQAFLYRSVLDSMLPSVDTASGIRRKGLVLAMITKLKQICNHPSLFLHDRRPLNDRSGKLSRLEEILETILAEGDRVLLFTQYAQMGHLLQPYLQERFNRETVFLHGSLSKAARDRVLARFRDPAGPPIFILSLKAGGLGLNLTEANQVVHYDQWWNPAVQDQATDRAYRIGQKRNVQVRTFVCSGTLEERIQKMLEHKKNLADRIVESTKNVVTQLSTDELRKLLQFTGSGHIEKN